MQSKLNSLFDDIPLHLPEELCQTLLESHNVRIERILSQGQRSKENDWYDQKQTEWVLLLQGRARIGFVDSQPVELNPGDYLLLPAHCKHRVDWTDPHQISIWLAVHISENITNDSRNVAW